MFKVVENLLFWSADRGNYQQIPTIESETLVNSSGHTKLSNGLIINFGKDTRNSDSSYTITFDQSYTTAPVVTCTRIAANSGSPMNAATVTTTGFTIDRDNAIDGDQTIHYIAIGI